MITTAQLRRVIDQFHVLFGKRAPCTVIFEAALSMSRRSSGVSSTVSCSDVFLEACSFVVPGIGTIHGFWASSHASAI